MNVAPSRTSIQRAPPRPLSRATALFGAAAAILAGAILLGWGLEIEPLRALFIQPGHPRPGAAFGMLSGGLALCGLHRPLEARATRALAYAAAALTAGIGLLGLISIAQPALSPESLGLELLAPVTALGLLLVGVASILAALRRFNSLTAQIAAGTALTLAFLVLLGYAYSAEGLYHLPGSNQSALWCAVGWALLAAGVMVARPEYALARILAGRSLGADQLRRTLPAMLAVPLATGIAALAGMRAGWYRQEAAFAVFTVLAVLALALVGAANARRIDQLAGDRAKLQDLLRRAFDNAAIGVALLDSEGRWTHVNDCLCEIVGWSREELVGHSFREITHPDDLAGDLAALEAFRSGEIDSDHLEKRYITRGGEPIWVNISVSTERDKNGDVAFFIAMVQDISERKQAERAREEFFALVSHELRSPLHVLTSWLAVMRREGSPETRARAAEIAERSAAALARLIGDLLDASRIASGKLEIEREVFDLLDVARSAVAGLEPVAQDRQVKLSFRHRARHVFVEGDPGRIEQVVRNLVDNALKFTPAGGSVDVELELEPGEAARVAVRDTGQGIPAELLPRIFERFQQGRQGPRGASKGLGLGLSIVRHLVELHGGHVEAASAGPRRGSTFMVTLPMVPLPRRLAPAPAPSRGDALEGVRVLLLDPDRTAAEALALGLEDVDASVEWIASADEALARLESRPPRVLVAEIDRLGDEALEVARTLAERSQGEAVAIAVSTSDLPVVRRRAREAGFRTVLARPLEPARLVASIESLLNAPERVLVVDDDRDAADSLAILLSRRGFEVERAYDGAGALRVADRFSPDCVLTDLHLGDCEGTALARALREARPAGDGRPRIVLVTGRTAEEIDVDEALFDGHVRKPVDLAVLLELLRPPS